jgi:hypothetical protein
MSGMTQRVDILHGYFLPSAQIYKLHEDALFYSRFASPGPGPLTFSASRLQLVGSMTSLATQSVAATTNSTRVDSGRG